MSLTPEHIQEDLSVAYISAVAANAGFDCAIYPNRHDYGTDIIITPIEIDEDGNRQPSGRTLRIQAKATYTVDPSCNSHITYKLKKTSYNKLVKDTGIASPYILVLYCMPRDDKDWLSVHDHQQTVLKHCGYWISLKGRERTKNTDKISINIPKDHVFNETSLKYIMKTIQNLGAQL
jgi:hypothetical protein